MLQINDSVTIDEAELEFEYARSSGPGGQNVNKVETKVTLRFPVNSSSSLGDTEKRRIADRLATRITKEGILRVVSQRHRTRGANQNAAVVRFVELLAEALQEEAERKKTRTPKAVKRRRLESKRRRSQKKQLRSRPSLEE